MDICVVLVTFNRKDDLQKTLAAYEGQTHLPRAVIVVDNHSTDGTDQMLARWQVQESEIAHIVVTLPENVGGSGGFAAGLSKALELEHEWVFVSDDDALPQADALQQLADFCERSPELAAQCAALCGSVDTGEGYALGHRCRIQRGAMGRVDQPVPAAEYEKEYFEVDFFSYIGTCIRRSALEKVGVTRKEFFIYSDDFEHALRVRQCGKLFCLPRSVLCHQGNTPYSKNASWRDYYETRNVLIMYLEHFGKTAFRRRARMRLLTGLRSLNPTKIKVIKEGIRDAKAGKTGLHPVYRPGWDPKKK